MVRSIAKLVILFLATTAAQANPTYSITNLGSLSDGYSAAYGINENGMIVGQSFNAVSGLNEAVVWSGGSIQSLGFQGLARAVNNSGTVVGETGIAVVQVPTGRAFSWSSGAYTDLGDLGGANSGAYDINDAGQITGFAMTGNGTPAAQFSHAFLYENGVMSDLGTVSTPTGYSRGHGINDSGEIAGRASLVDFADSEKHMATWDTNGAISSHIPPGSGYSTAQQINNLGVVAGNGFTSTGQERAMIWDSGVVTTLGTLGGVSSRAWSINDAGVVVGYAEDAGGLLQAMVSFDAQSIVELSTLVGDMSGWTRLTGALDISETGQIVGVGITASGQSQAFLLTPIPIPGGVWLLGSALALLGWARRRVR